MHRTNQLHVAFAQKAYQRLSVLLLPQKRAQFFNQLGLVVRRMHLAQIHPNQLKKMRVRQRSKTFPPVDDVLNMWVNVSHFFSSGGKSPPRLQFLTWFFAPSPSFSPTLSPRGRSPKTPINQKYEKLNSNRQRIFCFLFHFVSNSIILQCHFYRHCNFICQINGHSIANHFITIIYIFIYKFK